MLNRVGGVVGGGEAQEMRCANAGGNASANVNGDGWLANMECESKMQSSRCATRDLLLKDEGACAWKTERDEWMDEWLHRMRTARRSSPALLLCLLRSAALTVISTSSAACMAAQQQQRMPLDLPSALTTSTLHQLTFYPRDRSSSGIAESREWPSSRIGRHACNPNPASRSSFQSVILDS